MDGVRDRELFTASTGTGGKVGAIYQSVKNPEALRQKPGAFLLSRLDEEIARIEIPQWVAQDEKRLNLVHTLVLDQCRRGQGYPVALGEAHEKAVITGADRENFWQMVESSLIAEHLPTLGSAKSQSKKTRWV